MNKITVKTAILITAGLIGFGAKAQDDTKRFGKTLQVLPCATPEYDKMLQKNGTAKHTDAVFENWMQEKIALKKKFKSDNQNQVVTLPVVVHVIHNGGAVGEEENISDEQIMSQITVLNQDFRRLEGTNGYNTHPDGADVQVEFCLAQRDPNGLATNGIDRITIYNNSQTGFDLADTELIKAQTQWDPEKYINIWTFKLVTTQAAFEIYGYAQFPTDSGLDGLVDPSMSTTANTDGIIVAAKCFGSKDIYPQGYYMPGRNLGRTVSHEMGHYLGLRHTWGDENNCTADDYCADTPIIFTAHSGPCPATGEDSCPDSPGLDMFENYMDYTNDVCLNIFTQDQKERIRTVLENAPRRVTLASSGSCTPGAVFNNDGSLRIQNFNMQCNSSQITPELLLSNPGNTAITTATIQYYIDSNAPEFITWEGNLAQGESAIVAIPQVTVAPGNHTFSYALVTVNGQQDEAPLNDARAETFKINNFDTNEVVVTIRTDNNASQTRWAILDENQDEVFSYNGGQYQNNTTYTETIALSESGCYTFAIADLGQNGICCENGEGYYEVKTADGLLILQGGEFNYLELTDFGITTTLITKQPAAMGSNIVLYPNPSDNIINIAIPDTMALPEEYTVYNSLGQIMDKGKVNGRNTLLTISGYAGGVYFIKLSSGSESQNLQFIKQ